MSNVGVVMLAHTALYRAEQVARHWAASGCPVVIHVDKSVDENAYNMFQDRLSDMPLVRFSERHWCEWGSWGLVAASQSAAELILGKFPDVNHVYLTSGSCLPLRPVNELVAYLAQRPETDFIESATIADVPWITGGLGEERFTLRFPFSWKRQRALFDWYVRLQRLLKVKRKIPEGLAPHMGSQWWCLTRKTLSQILESDTRSRVDAYFRKVWIPDESYFQTLARRYGNVVESRSLTLSKFDFQGKPHVFYDDHLQLLRRSDCFVARKMWPQADRLYDAFLSQEGQVALQTEPNPGKIDRVFTKASERRLNGRAGLYMQSRYPDWHSEERKTSEPYSVFHGFNEVFENFEGWLSQKTGARVHGRIFAKEGAEFAHDQESINGCLMHYAKLRDYAPEAFLGNLIWNTRGEHQCFQFSPRDTQDVNWFMAMDANARIFVISGAWAVSLFQSKQDFPEIRQEAARLQRIEADYLKILKSRYTKARIHIWTMADFVETPTEYLSSIISEISVQSHSFSVSITPPQIMNLDGFGQFLQNLKNQGMHPYLMGDFAVDRVSPSKSKRKSYLIK